MPTLAEYQEWSKAMGCKEQDFADKIEFEACIADRKAQQLLTLLRRRLSQSGSR